MSESVFNKVAGLELSCEYCETFKNSVFHKTHPVVASEKFITFLTLTQFISDNNNKITQM